MREIEGKDICFSYEYEGSSQLSLDHVDIQVEKGSFIAILGPNGSGKSTLAKHFNALLQIQQGELYVTGLNVNDSKSVWELRRRCGMVFQNPNHQFVSSVVEEDIAFGLENYDTPSEMVSEKVKQTLATVGMSGYEKMSPHQMSGGQQQKIALAGVLAMEPDVLVFDEATSMLDPDGRSQILDQIEKLHASGKTILMITHDVEEAMLADCIYIMKQGKVLDVGTPRDILTNTELMKKAGLESPIAVRLYEDLKRNGVRLASCPLTEEELVEQLCQLN